MVFEDEDDTEIGYSINKILKNLAILYCPTWSLRDAKMKGCFTVGERGKTNNINTKRKFLTLFVEVFNYDKWLKYMWGT